MSKLVTSEIRGSSLRITLNDPASRNSLSDGMMAALAKTLDEAARASAVRAVIIAAMGPAYSAGHNLKEITARRGDLDGGKAYFDGLMRQCANLMMKIVRHPKPVIAEVQGVASAAGCQLVASCDLAIASEAASFQTPGVNIGLFCSTPMVALSRNLMRKHAMEMLLTADTIPAHDAMQMGLVNRVVSPNALSTATDALAARIASKSPAAIKVGKEAFYHQLDMPLADAYAYTARVMAENLMAGDAKEGIGAFIEKRAPKWETAQ